MATVNQIALLGATGSIGESTLRVIEAHPERLRLCGVAARSRWRELAKIVKRFKVPFAAIYDESAWVEARSSGLFQDVELGCGIDGLRHIATLPGADTVVSAIVGITGLQPTLDAIRAKKKIALASKEILVLAGKFVMQAAHADGVSILPVDSEHNAIFQCLQGSARPREIRKLLLTASGGAFRDVPTKELVNVSPEAAQVHPNWKMGPKITVDSATMANKGLEMIEAHWLFDVKPSQIEVVLHPQSIVHSMVEFIDGSILAQLSPPSMTFAIQYSLFHPERINGAIRSLDFSLGLRLDFSPPSLERYPCLRLAQEALETGGVAPAIFNAANAVAVDRFLAREITFTDIPRLIEVVLDKSTIREPERLNDVLDADAEARQYALNYES